MSATLVLRNHRFELEPGITVHQALRKFQIDPEAVLVTREGEMITEDEMIRDEDLITLIAVISGG